MVFAAPPLKLVTVSTMGLSSPITWVAASFTTELMKSDFPISRVLTMRFSISFVSLSKETESCTFVAPLGRPRLGLLLSAMLSDPPLIFIAYEKYS